MKENINKLFGQRLKEIRTNAGISQEELGDISGLHRTYIGQIERAEKNITLRNIEKIAVALNIEVKDLFDFKKL